MLFLFGVLKILVLRVDKPPTPAELSTLREIIKHERWE
jgi:hypothetical protein